MVSEKYSKYIISIAALNTSTHFHSLNLTALTRSTTPPHERFMYKECHFKSLPVPVLASLYLNHDFILQNWLTCDMINLLHQITCILLLDIRCKLPRIISILVAIRNSLDCFQNHLPDTCSKWCWRLFGNIQTWRNFVVN